MNAPTRIYEYEILLNPTQAAVNLLGASGWRVHQMALDPRDGALSVIVMERSSEAYMVSDGVTESDNGAVKVETKARRR